MYVFGGFTVNQCCGSVTFWYGTDQDPTPDPAIFVSDLQDGNKKIILCLLLFEATFTLFFKVFLTIFA
jgi:hypothetical protein